MHSFPISLRAFTSVFFQARHMGEALPCHARDCMGCRAWWFDCSKHYSILRLDMPHRDNANPDAPHKQHRLTYSSQAFLSPHYLTWTASPGVVAGPFLTLPEWQSWFCQCLGHRSPSHGSLC